MGTGQWAAALGVGLLAAAGAGAQSAALAPDELFERLAPSVWTVQTFDEKNQPVAGGSAVVIGPGSVVTNCHVLKKAARVTVTRENVSYGALPDHFDPERDLCLLRVRNFQAPAVTIANPEEMRIGARVYAIGSPRGLEHTISDGLLSGIRRRDDGELAALQVTVPISPGSSGGGLFDAQGRLVGITTFALRDSQNLNFAVPATWIAEIPQRAQAARAARADGRPAAAPGRGQVFEYRLRDRTTGIDRSVLYRLDRIDGERLIFNGGSRIEAPEGEVLALTAAIGGEFELAQPPGGWAKAIPAAGKSWEGVWSSPLPGRSIKLELAARAARESTVDFKDRPLRVLQVDYSGHTDRYVGLGGAGNRGSYAASVWYSPELGRVVRFEARSRGGSGGAAFLLDEVLELVDIRSE